MSLSAEQLLERSRQELLDLSTRNRLLALPVDAKFARVVHVHDERSSEVFRLLVVEKKSLSFRPNPQARPARRAKDDGDSDADDVAETIGLPQPEEADERAGPGPAKRHIDTRLQTVLSPEGLQARLLGLYRDARTMIEEQGVNILYLALGQLKWIEPEQTGARQAPLVLVPVEIHRKTAAEKFYIRWLEEDVQENLSLRARLKSDFDIDLPDFPDEEAFDLDRYVEAVGAAVAGAKGWEVLPNAITLGFFSFSKFLMYRDLDPKNWPEGRGLLQHPFITGLLQDGFPQPESMPPEQADLDELISAARLDHVVDADSSQSLAIEAVRQGRSMVIQGPPGTGKSQSISNIIATAVLDGKKVLFVAEKLAALEVVKRRLEKEGLGDLCLELHSNKSSKRAVVEEIGRTWKLGRPKDAGLESVVPKLERHRAVLNGHAKCLHESRAPTGQSPFEVIGELALLGSKGREAADLAFPGAETWTHEARQERRHLAGELAGRVQEIGPPSRHPWRGACCETLHEIDLEPLESSIRTALASLAPLRESAGALAAALGQPPPGHFKAADQHRLSAHFVATAPPLDKQAIVNFVWDSGLEGLNDLVEEGRKFEIARACLTGHVAESAWDQDVSGARAHLAAHGRSWLRMLNGDYRRSLALLRGLIAGSLPKAHDERLALADQLISGQRALRALRDGDTLGQAAFGGFWRREKSDWPRLGEMVEWVRQQQAAGLGSSFRILFAGVREPEAVGRLGVELAGRLESAREDAAQVFERLNLDSRAAFGAADMDFVPLDALAERCSLWLLRMDDLPSWTRYYVRARHARDLSLGSLVERLESGEAPPESALDCFDRACLGQVLRDFMRQVPALGEFDGVLHEKQVREFRALDKERVALSQHRVLTAHFAGLPPAAGVGPAGIMRGEMERKRGHRTVRRLLKDAGSVVQAIKPVFMMSPLSVAQFLEPGAVEFDLLVVDEASQVEPVDAFGAIARCRQIVVVGDSRQLPPTRFFARMTSNVPEPDEGEALDGVAEAKDIESILGLCCARGLPQTMLRWHYRSRHHSLIAVSNHEFYENRLFIVPSPHSSAAGLGLRFHHVADGVFDTAATGTNHVEAKAVCRAVIEHARQTPELSLGVAAFSARQQQAILDELEVLRRDNPDCEAFFAGHLDEPFFIKNLENVQGDERDVIFISVGYGRDARGKLAMRFGPLSIEGGERRLNVLISRAKRRCEVFSSILDEDIDLERASGRGVAAFKTFLGYAQKGLLAPPAHAARAETSPFENAVRGALESLGHEIHPRVGVAGFYIDLAVANPARPGHFLLGIECDGAPYRASRSARDRDRLRQAVLEDHGWMIHRIWSVDWFQRPAEQLRKVVRAIERATERAQAEARHTPAPSNKPVEAAPPAAIEREAAAESGDSGLHSFAVPYAEARFPVPSGREPQELEPKKMAGIVLRIVEAEGPIHEIEVVARVRGLWELSRAGNRVQDCVAAAVQRLLDTGACVREDAFLRVPGEPVPVRSRRDVQSQGLRKPDMLPPVEIRAAILALIDAHHGASSSELPVAVARVFGFKTTSGPLRTAIEAQAAALRGQAVIDEVDGMLKRVG